MSRPLISIARRLTYSLVATIIAISLFSVWHIHTLARDEMQQALNAKAGSVMEYLAGSLGFPLWNLSDDITQKIAATVVQDSSIAQLEIYDMARQKTVYALQRNGGASLILMQRPILHDGVKVGELRLAMAPQSYEKAINQSLVSTLWLVAVIVCSVILLMMVLLRAYIDKPFARLTRWVNAYGEGRYDSPLAPVAYQEFQALEQVLMQMGRKIEEQLRAQRELNQELEQRVLLRTRHLSDALEFNETILNNSPLPMGVFSASGQCMLANEAFAHFIGITRESLLGQDYRDLAAWQSPGLLDDCQLALAEHTPRQREIRMSGAGGQEVWCEYRILPTHLSGEDHLLIQFFDLSQRKRMEEELRHIAFHDALTKLPNRRLLLDRMEQAIKTSKRNNSHVAVLFLDLNKFKQLNDTHGHDAGDQLLVEVAKRLTHTVRTTDTVARLGGDEFVVMLENLGPDNGKAAEFAASVADKIRIVLSVEYVLGAIRHQGSASVGIKLFLGGEHDPDVILMEADSAMYAAKRRASRLPD